MLEDVERLGRYAFLYLTRQFGPMGAVYGVLIVIAVAVLWWLGTTIAPKLVNAVNVRLDAGERLARRGRIASEQQLRGLLRLPWRRYFPVFGATYILAAGVAVLLGRFSVEAAFVACPAIAAAASYLFYLRSVQP